MPDPRAKIRLHVDATLAPGAALPLAPDQAHYLFTVMRAGAGTPVLAFNGRDGEWRCRAEPVGRRGGVLHAEAQTRPQAGPPDLWLLFAPVKKARTDFIVEKAVELGVRRLLPVTTRHTAAERLRPDRLRAQATEAAEQCGALVVPEIAEARPLSAVLAAWPPDRALVFCDESGAGRPLAAVAPPPPAALLTGPEGGFAPEEAAALRALPFVQAVSLGPRILRTETAALAALALWQAAQGDWRGDTPVTGP